MVRGPTLADDTFIYSFICPLIWSFINLSPTTTAFTAFESGVDVKCAANVHA